MVRHASRPPCMPHTASPGGRQLRQAGPPCGVCALGRPQACEERVTTAFDTVRNRKIMETVPERLALEAPNPDATRPGACPPQRTPSAAALLQFPGLLVLDQFLNEGPPVCSATSLAHEPFREALGEGLASPPGLCERDRGACRPGPSPLSHRRGRGRDGGCQRHREAQDLRSPGRCRVSARTTVPVQPPRKPARGPSKNQTQNRRTARQALLGVRPEEGRSPSRSDVRAPQSLPHHSRRSRRGSPLSVHDRCARDLSRAQAAHAAPGAHGGSPGRRAEQSEAETRTVWLHVFVEQD